MPARRTFPLLLLFLVLVVGLGVVGWRFYLRPTSEGVEVFPTSTVGRGPLRVTVLEGGSLEALASHTVTSRVEGQAAILFIVEEGVIITPVDVAAKKILVQLDSSGIEERLEKQKIDLAQARASHENAASNLEIQRQQNASDIRQAELDVRFALLDLSRYVGSALVQELTALHRRAIAPTPLTEDPVGAGPDAAAGSPPSGLRRLILTLLESENLEGEAKQTTRQLLSDISLAEEECTRAQVELDWSLKLEEKGYVSREEKEADRIALERRRIELERARTANDQYAQYDFPKEVEQLLSNLTEAEDHLSRTVKRANSAEAKAVADADSRREQKTLQEARFEKLRSQLDACVIRAETPGLVVYASSGRRRRWDRGERIQEGTSVRERQPIINIPDLSQLGVKADIHESLVEQVKPGQKVAVVVDALPDRTLMGEVTNVAPLPNPSESWFNPDRKVYATTIRLDEIPENVRPGMSAQVEILVARLDDVLRVPVQAVTGTAENPRVHVVDDECEYEERPVVLGRSNDRYVQVLGGLVEGERILLAPDRPAGLGPADASVPKEGKRGPSKKSGRKANGGRRTKSR